MHTLKSMSLLFSQVCCCIHLGYISEHKNPIVSIHFLNEWGDLQVVPYKAQTPDGKIIGPVLQLEIQYSMFLFFLFLHGASFCGITINFITEDFSRVRVSWQASFNPAKFYLFLLMLYSPSRSCRSVLIEYKAS